MNREFLKIFQEPVALFLMRKFFLIVLKLFVMKKSVVVLCLALAVLSSACSFHTCPTYSHGPSQKVLKETKF
jgi:hypothetical protein